MTHRYGAFGPGYASGGPLMPAIPSLMAGLVDENGIPIDPQGADQTGSSPAGSYSEISTHPDFGSWAMDALTGFGAVLGGMPGLVGAGYGLANRGSPMSPAAAIAHAAKSLANSVFGTTTPPTVEEVNNAITAALQEQDAARNDIGVVGSIPGLQDQDAEARSDSSAPGPGEGGPTGGGFGGPGPGSGMGGASTAGTESSPGDYRRGGRFMSGGSVPNVVAPRMYADGGALGMPMPEPTAVPPMAGADMYGGAPPMQGPFSPGAFYGGGTPADTKLPGDTAATYYNSAQPPMQVGATPSPYTPGMSDGGSVDPLMALISRLRSEPQENYYNGPGRAARYSPDGTQAPRYADGGGVNRRTGFRAQGDEPTGRVDALMKFIREYPESTARHWTEPTGDVDQMTGRVRTRLDEAMAGAFLGGGMRPRGASPRVPAVHQSDQPFSKFSMKRAGENTDSDYSEMAKIGHFFLPEAPPSGFITPNAKVSYPVDLQIENPLLIERGMGRGARTGSEDPIDLLRKMLSEHGGGDRFRNSMERRGHDSVILRGSDDAGMGGADQYITFSDQQITPRYADGGSFGVQLQRETPAGIDLTSAYGAIPSGSLDGAGDISMPDTPNGLNVGMIEDAMLGAGRSGAPMGGSATSWASLGPAVQKLLAQLQDQPARGPDDSGERFWRQYKSAGYRMPQAQPLADGGTPRQPRGAMVDAIARMMIERMRGSPESYAVDYDRGEIPNTRDQNVRGTAGRGGVQNEVRMRDAMIPRGEWSDRPEDRWRQPTYRAMHGQGPDFEDEWGMADGGRFAPGGEVRPGSYVIPSDVMAAAGNGDNETGGRRLGARLVRGPGDGRSDDVAAHSGGQPLRLSNGEGVVPPERVRAHGGADALDRKVLSERRKYKQRLGAFGRPRGAAR